MVRIVVTVNFGDKPFKTADGSDLAPGGLKVVGVTEINTKTGG